MASVAPRKCYLNKTTLGVLAKYNSKPIQLQKNASSAFGGAIFVDKNNTSGNGYYKLLYPSSVTNPTTNKKFPSGANVWVNVGGTINDIDEKYNSLSVQSGEKYNLYVLQNGKYVQDKRIITSDNMRYKIVVVKNLAAKSGLIEMVYPEWLTNVALSTTTTYYLKKITSNSGNVAGAPSDPLDTSDDTTTVTGETSAAASGSDIIPEDEEIILTKEELNQIDDMIDNVVKTIDESQANEIFGINRLPGTPFQFLESADYRPMIDVDKGYDNIGRGYIENILTEAPIVYFMPGEPTFLAGMSKNQKEVVQNYIQSRQDDGNIKAFNELMAEFNQDGQDFGRYYDFKGNYADYMRHVNLLCRASAVFIGIGDRLVPDKSGTKYKDYDWSKWGNLKSYEQVRLKTDEEVEDEDREETESGKDMGIFKQAVTYITNAVEEGSQALVDNLLGDWGYFKCYVDPSSSFSESISNDTTSSKVESLFDTVEDLYKEAEYLLSSHSAMNTIREKLQPGLDSIATDGNLSKILGLGSQVLAGANLIFPEIWRDSASSKSYTFTVNLVSPYGDIESIYLNTIMPMMHLLALGLPRQASANSFTAPFIVRVFKPGHFSCDLGIVDSIQITKVPNGNDAWNVNGLPTEIQVSLGVKDLYTQLMMTSTMHPIQFMNNQGLIDFLGVVCGLNFAKPTLVVRTQAIISVLKGTIFGTPGEIVSDFRQSLSNALKGIVGMK